MNDYFNKACLWIRWCNQAFKAMTDASKNFDIEEVERNFVYILLLVDGVHDALKAAAPRQELAEWRVALDAHRDDDPLLSYFFLARNSEAHGALVKWREGMMHMDFKIALPETFRLLSCGAKDAITVATRVAFKVFQVDSMEALEAKRRQGIVPTIADELAAGIKIVSLLHSLSLQDFEIGRRSGKPRTVAAPTQHLDKFIPPSAHEATRLVIAFYEAKRDELELLARSRESA